jgi:hypothetical protein
MKHLNIVKSAAISEIVKQAVGMYGSPTGQPSTVGNSGGSIPSIPAPAEIPGGTGDKGLDSMLEQAEQPSQRYINRISAAGKRPQYEAQYGPIKGMSPGYAETPYDAETSGVGGYLNNLRQRNNAIINGVLGARESAKNYLDSFRMGSGADKRMDAEIAAAEQPSTAYTRAMRQGTNHRAFVDKVRKDYGANPTIPRATPVNPQPPAQVGPPAPAPAGKAPIMPASRPAAPATDFNAMFRKQHGSAFDPNSRVDKQKMQQLQARYKG